MEWTANSKTHMLYWIGLLLLLHTPNFTHQELANQNFQESPGLEIGLPHFSGKSEPMVDGIVMTESVYSAKEGEGNFSLEKLGHGLSRLEGSLSSLVQSFLTVQRSVVNLEQLQELLVLLLEDILKQTANMSKGKVNKQGSEVTYPDKFVNRKSSNESQDEDDDMHSDDRDVTDQDTDPLPVSRVMTPVGGSFDPLNNIIDGKQSVVTTSQTDSDTSGGASSGGSNSDENFSSVGVLQTPRQDEILIRSSQWAEPMTEDNTDIGARLKNVISRINSRLTFALKDQPNHQIKSAPAESPLDLAPGQFEPLEIKSYEDDLLHGDDKRGSVSFHVKLKQILPTISHHGHLVVSHGGPLTGPEKASSPFLEDFEDTSGKESSGERPTGMINNLLLSNPEEGNVTGTHEILSGHQIQHSGTRIRRQTGEQVALTKEGEQNNSSKVNSNNEIVLLKSHAINKIHSAQSTYKSNITTDNIISVSQVNQTRDKILSITKANQPNGKNLSLYKDIKINDNDQSVARENQTNDNILTRSQVYQTNDNIFTRSQVYQRNDNDLSTSQVNQTNSNTLSPSQGHNTIFPRIRTENASESGQNTAPESVNNNKTFSQENITYLLNKKALFASSKAHHLDTGSVKTYLTSILHKNIDTRPQDHPTMQTYSSITPVNKKINLNSDYIVHDGSASHQMKNYQRLSNENSSNNGDSSAQKTIITIKIPPAKRFSQTVVPSETRSVTDPTRRAGVQDTKVIIMPPIRKISLAAFTDNIKEDSKGEQEPNKGENPTKKFIHDVKNTLKVWITATAGSLGKQDENAMLSTKTTHSPLQEKILMGESADLRQPVGGLGYGKWEISISPETSNIRGKDNLHSNDDSLEDVDDYEHHTNVLFGSFQAEMLSSESHNARDDEEIDANGENTNTLISEHDIQKIIQSRSVLEDNNSVQNRHLQNSNFLLQVEDPHSSMTDKQAAIGRHDVHNTVLTGLPRRATSFSMLRDLMKTGSKRQKRYSGIFSQHHLQPPGHDANQKTGIVMQKSFPMSGLNFPSRTPSVQYRKQQDSTPQNTGSAHYYQPPTSGQTHLYPPQSSGQIYHRPFLNHQGGGFYRPYHTSLNYAHYLNQLGINLPSLLQQRNQDHEETTMQDSSIDMEDMLSNMFQRYWQRIYNHYIQTTTTEVPDMDWDDTTLKFTEAQPTISSSNTTVLIVNATNNTESSPLPFENITTANSTATVT